MLALSTGAHAAEAREVAGDYERTRSAFEAVTKEVRLSEERIGRLTAEIAGVKRDHASITAALIQAAKTENKLSRDIDEISARLDLLQGQQDAIHISLAKRRGVLAEVLGALQRMGLNPPPAILVKPDDALSSVRSAILLGAVVPELREQTEVLMADMAELSRVTASIQAERGRLVASVAEQMAEKKRLALLLEAKQQLQAETEAQLAQEQKRAGELAAKAGSLKELIASLESQAAKDRAAREKADKRDAEIAALPENNRALGSLPFSGLRKQLALPANGRFTSRFGAKDSNGGVMQGDTLATQSGAIVTAPADGNVLYAGPFRSYGQLLILDAGDGYHVVLAGMGRITVALGRSVMAGEPVGAMSEARLANSQPGTVVANGPELYIEFRKDGKPVDPSPWWAERVAGRAGNGS